MVDIKQLIKDQLRKRLSERQIMDYVVSKSSDQDLHDTYESCQAMVLDPQATGQELENLKSQLDMLDVCLRKHKKEHIITAYMKSERIPPQQTP